MFLQELGCQSSQCGKGVCGSNCSQCCPLYNQHLPRPSPNGVQCEPCNCFGHADSCIFNQTVADSRASLNSRLELIGGGVCMDCKHNTAGVNCERCKHGYFRPNGVDRSSVDACVPCDCNYIGATGSCVADDSRAEEGWVSNIYDDLVRCQCLQLLLCSLPTVFGRLYM